MRQEATRTVDLGALIDSVAAELPDLGHELAVPDSGRVLVACRPVALRRASRNLLENAGAHGVRATARVADDDGRVLVVIEDDGPGIPEADLERMFEPCVRLDEPQSGDTGGAGLGLAIARTSIRGHGGDIRLQNRAEGGLRATVVLCGNAGGRSRDGRGVCDRPRLHWRVSPTPAPSPAAACNSTATDRPTRAGHASRHCRHRSLHGQLRCCPARLRQLQQWRGHKCGSPCRRPLRHGQQCRPRKCRSASH